MSRENIGAPLSGSGSRPSDQAASHPAPSGFDPSRKPPTDGRRFLALVDGDWRLVAWGKVSHVPITGWILVDQGAEEAELCEFTEWFLLPDYSAQVIEAACGGDNSVGSVEDESTTRRDAPNTSFPLRHAPLSSQRDLEALSQAATPGSWSASKWGYQILTGDSWNTICTFHGDGKDHRMAAWEDGRGAAEPWSNADFIVALVNAYRAGILRLVSAPAVPAPPAGTSPLKRVRHVKRGTEYEVLGEAEAQVSVGHTIPLTKGVLRSIADGDRLTIYRGEDGKLWCRFTDEMRDGRFEPSRPQTKGGEG